MVAQPNKDIRILQFKVVEGDLTHSTEVFGKMSPFVKIKSEHIALKTKVLERAGKKPKWDQQFEIDPSFLGEIVTLEVLDQDMSSTDLIGEAKLPKAELLSDVIVDRWIEIFYGKNRDKNAGRIHCIYQLVGAALYNKVGFQLDKQYSLHLKVQAADSAQAPALEGTDAMVAPLTTLLGPNLGGIVAAPTEVSAQPVQAIPQQSTVSQNPIQMPQYVPSDPLQAPQSIPPMQMQAPQGIPPTQIPTSNVPLQSPVPQFNQNYGQQIQGAPMMGGMPQNQQQQPIMQYGYAQPPQQYPQYQPQPVGQPNMNLGTAINAFGAFMGGSGAQFQVPPMGYNQAPPMGYNQMPPMGGYNQVPQMGGYNQVPTMGAYNQAPTMSFAQPQQMGYQQPLAGYQQMPQGYQQQPMQGYQQQPYGAQGGYQQNYQ